MVVKKDGMREEFDRSKIEKGLLRACHKRPVSADTIAKMVDEIEKGDHIKARISVVRE